MDVILGNCCVHLVRQHYFKEKNRYKFSEFTDTKDEGMAYLARHREIIPGVYNTALSEGRTTGQTQLLTAREFNVALNSGFSEMNSRFEVKKEMLLNEITEVRQRMVNKTDGLDDSDIEFLCELVDDEDGDTEFDLLMSHRVVEAENGNENQMTENNTDVNVS